MAILNDKLIEMARPGTFLDIGANQGMYLEAMSQKATKVYAFEPHPENVAYMREHFSHLTNVEIAPIALNNEDNFIKLYQCSRNHAQHTISQPVAANPIWGHSEEDFITIPALTLDTFCNQHNVADITAIKLDVEGAEEQVLLGAMETLTKNNPIISLETHFPINEQAVDALIKKLGYTFFNANMEQEETIRPDMQYLLIRV